MNTTTSENTQWMATASFALVFIFAGMIVLTVVFLAWHKLLRLAALLLTPLAPIARSTTGLLARTPLADSTLRRYFYPARHRAPATT